MAVTLVCPRSSTTQNQPSTALVKHLRRAGQQTLTGQIAVEANAEVARFILALLLRKAPRHFAGLIEQRAQEIPSSRRWILDLPQRLLQLAGILALSSQSVGQTIWEETARSRMRAGENTSSARLCRTVFTNRQGLLHGRR
jgi:hypothetical protein